MSFFDDAISALIKPSRQFGPIVAQIVISERHTDRAEKTSHPVELGANISDHIILLPTQVVVRMGWTNYGLQTPSNVREGSNRGRSGPNPEQHRRRFTSTILGIMYQRVPFTLVTGQAPSCTNMILLGVVRGHGRAHRE